MLQNIGAVRASEAAGNERYATADLQAIAVFELGQKAVGAGLCEGEFAWSRRAPATGLRGVPDHGQEIGEGCFLQG